MSLLQWNTPKCPDYRGCPNSSQDTLACSIVIKCPDYRGCPDSEMCFHYNGTCQSDLTIEGVLIQRCVSITMEHAKVT